MGSVKIADIEAAFLCGDLDEEILMDCQKGLEGAKPMDMLVFKKFIHGLVQAS